jgi:drug/metabolite transporter (DMT)-like permease
MRSRHVLLMILVAFLWAICFPLINVGLAGAPPLVFAAMRAALAGVLLVLLAVVLRRPWPRGVINLGLIAAIGASFTALGFGGMFLGGGKISPGAATVLANIQPLFAAVLAVLFLSERLTPRIAIGLLSGFFGVVIMSLPGFTGQNREASLQAVVFITLGAVGTAVGNVLLKRLAGRTGVDVLMATGLQLLAGACLLAVAAQSMGSGWAVTWTARFGFSLIGLAVFGSALVTVLWFHLLERAPLTRLNSFTFLTPIFGLLLGRIFFAERFGLAEVAGMVFIVIGVQMIAMKPKPLFAEK